MPVTIGLVAATELEIAPFLATANVPVCITGVGAAATVYNTMEFIARAKPSILVQAGIAGSFDREIPLATTFIVSEDRFADLGVLEGNQWKDLFDMGLADPNSPPFKEGWLVNQIWHGFNPGRLNAVRGVSANEVATEPERIKRLKDKYRPVVESMEGAAFHFTCLRMKIPFLQVRSVSNYLGERNKDNWEIEKAILSLDHELKTIISFLSSKT